LLDRFRYRAYGLCLDVNRPLPFLVPAAPCADVDVYIEFAGTQPFPLPLQERAEWYASPQQTRSGDPKLTIVSLDGSDGQGFVQLRFGGHRRFAEFTISQDAKQVWASWGVRAPFEDIAWLFVRPVMSMILWLRGITCLHASVVAVNGGAIAFVGGNGAGKSSTAAALAQRGYAVLADDVAVLVDAQEFFLVPPTYPTLALQPQTAQELLGAQDLPPLWSEEEKRHLHLEQGTGAFRFEANPLALAAIYFLGARGPNHAPFAVERVTPAEGLVRLLANRYLRAHRSNEQRIRQFDLLSRVAKQVPLRQVQFPNELTALPRVCEMIAQDMSEFAIAI